MVEAVALINDVAVGLVPRTRNPAAPYGKRRVRRNEGIKALTNAEEGLDAEGVVLSSRAQPEGCVKRIEQAGKWYRGLQEKYTKLAERIQLGASAHFDSDNDNSEEEKKSGSDEDNKGEDGVDDSKKEEFEKKRKTKTKEQIEKEALEGNLYGALEMVEKTYDATEKEITKAYRKMALKYHPDKLGDKLTDRDKEIWLKIQEAYETLMDPAKRRKYDSSLPFDDKIPEEGKFDKANFYEVFTKCFDLNSRWSVNKNTPNFGNEHMPLANVKKFYRFWNEFKSWREFSQYHEYDTDEAQDRYERRYMQNENRRVSAKYEKAERGRIIRLVETAYNNDPRIQAELAEIEAEKQRKKEEIRQRKIATQLAKTEAIRKVQEQKEAAEQAKQDEAVAAAAAKKASDLAYKASIKALIALIQETLAGTNFDRFWVEGKQRNALNKTEKVQVVIAIVEAVKARTDLDIPAKVELFKSEFEMIGQTEAQRKEAAARKAAQEEEKKEIVVEDNNWSKEDITLLTKAITKFPPGTTCRWKVITEFCGRRNQKEVIKKAQELATKRQNDLEERREENERKAKEQQARISKAADAIEAQQKSVAAAKAKKPVAQTKATPDASAEVEDAEGWTGTQQTQMELAMKEFPSSMATKERWIAIAGKVDGKVAKDCFTRFKSIVAKLKAEQQAK